MSSFVAGIAPFSRTARQSGVSVKRHFTQAGVDPLSTVQWERRRAEIKGADGRIISAMDDVEVPTSWSQSALDIAADKYFRKAGVPGRGYEHSVRQLVTRVAKAIRGSGERQGGYFASPQDAETFEAELTFMLVNQYGAFNSPVWFNAGLHEAYGLKGDPSGLCAWNPETGEIDEMDSCYVRPQVSACFIQSIKDDLMDIADFVKREMRLFKFGSGSGANFSNLRAQGETLSGGGTSSGMMSFLKVFDVSAGSIKSGGVTRRAAKMVCVDVDHPDVWQFVEWKAKEEDKALALIKAGYSSDFNGEAYQTVAGQNANNSVRVSDEFMRAVVEGRNWDTKWRKTGKVARSFEARNLWRRMSECAWRCADPGIQFDTTINNWHTTPASGRINASNPCCIVGDALVDTSEGLIEFEKLESMSSAGRAMPMAFAFDLESGMPVLRQIKKVWVAGETKTLVDVVTDKGITIRCTPEHRFLLRSGDYVEAKDLTAGQRLRKIGRSVNVGRADRRVLNHKVTDAAPNGTVWQNRFVWEQANGPIPDGYHVHHKNDDPTDDRLSNLELREGVDHWSEHATGLSNPNSIEADERVLVETWEAIEAESGETTVWRWNAYINKHDLKGVVPLASGDGRIRGMEWSEFAEWIDARRELVNDRVLSVSVVNLAEPVKVYDMEVEGTHNFAVTSRDAKGLHTIVVHNSEYMSLDDSACNLASLNLMKFMRKVNGGGWSFDVESFMHAASVFTLAQEILVDYASYPTAEIAKNTHDFRQLGLGYANLGTLLMVQGIPYDSPQARGLAGAITALLTGTGYRTSAEIAASKGPFSGFAHNREPMLKVMGMHRQAVEAIDPSCPQYLTTQARRVWDEVVALGSMHGFRNAQATVLAPTGTIGFMMDCDTTGVEPDFALVKSKKLAGGGFMEITNRSVPAALESLGYTPTEVKAIVAHIERTGMIEGAPGLKDEHVAAFDCANRCGKLQEVNGQKTMVFGQRFIAPMGHIKMLEAVQPFVSGSISKTVNCPKETTVEEIEALHMEAWKRGLKCIAIYRDDSKHSQVLSSGTGDGKAKDEKGKVTASLPSLPPADAPVSVRRTEDAKKQADDEQPSQYGPPPTRRHRLPKPKRPGGDTFELKINGQKFYLRTGEYADGSLGEVFIDLHKDGSTMRSMMNMFAIAVSLGLQHGVPLQEFVDAFTFQKFDPAGGFDHPYIKRATSIVDGVFKVLALEYLDESAYDEFAQNKPTPDEMAEIRAARAVKMTLAQARLKGKAVVPAKIEAAVNGNGSGHVNGNGSVSHVNGNGNGNGTPKTGSYARASLTEAQMCRRCGGLTQRSGTCHTCTACGSNTGCS